MVLVEVLKDFVSVHKAIEKPIKKGSIVLFDEDDYLESLLDCNTVRRISVRKILRGSPNNKMDNLYYDK